jgi:hypothetical protein
VGRHFSVNAPTVRTLLEQISQREIRRASNRDFYHTIQNGAIATSDSDVECELFSKGKFIEGRLIEFSFVTAKKG